MFETAIAFLAKTAGTSFILSSLRGVVSDVAKSAGVETAIEHVLEIPQADLQVICSKTGADINKAIELRDIAAKAVADFTIFIGTDVNDSTAT